MAEINNVNANVQVQQQNANKLGLKAGLKEADLKTDKEKSIFKAVDKDGNGVLDANELEAFANAMKTNNDNEVSKKEAKSYIKGNNDLKEAGVKKKDLLQFLENNNINTDNVQDTQILEKNGEKLVQITYNDGHKETIKPDKSFDITTTDDNGNTVTESRDKDKNLTQKTTVAENGDSTKVEYENVDGKAIPKTETTETDNGNKTTTTQFENGKKVQTTKEDKTKGSTAVINYDENEAPTKATVTQGQNEFQYEYNNGRPRLTNSTVNKGTDNEINAKYTYDDNAGTVTSEEKQASINGTKTTTTIKKQTGEFIQSTTVDGDKTTTLTKNTDDDGYTEVIADSNSKTTNILNAEQHRLTQTKVVDGQEYTLNYDGEGNTTGIIVQNGESPSSIARKFGCSEQELREVNKEVLGDKKYFDVGSEIKIPREIDADDNALKGRKSAKEAKAEFARDEQIRAEKRAEAKARNAEATARKAEAAARDKALRQDLGLINYKGAGTKVQGDWYRNGKKTRTETYTKIGNATHGRTICQDKQGKVYVIAHNGVVLKETWVNVSAHREVQQIGNRRVAVEKGMRDGHGRKTVYDGDGNALVMSQDKKILKSSHVAKSDKSDAIRKDSKTAQQATVEMLDSQLAAAKENFNEQMKQDGWSGDFADGVSKIWNNDLFGGGTGNTADQVRQDFKTYQNNINQLKAAAKQGDGAFKAKFKQIYGIDYNQKAIADYNMNPTEANYRKAFGTKNNIGERVAKYNASQQLGSTVVKTGVEVAVAGSAIAAADVLEVASFGTSTPVSMAIASAATFASDVVVEGSDRLNITGKYRDADGNIVKTDGAFKEGTDAGAILEDAGKDALIAGATLGLGKFANSAYKVGKTAYATSKVASKTATVGEKAVATVAKAETGVARATTTATRAETGVARATTTATHAETGVARATTTATHAETGVARATTTATHAETGVARATTTATHAKTGVAKVETGVAKTETVAQKAETTASKAEDAASKTGEAAQEATGAGAKTSHIAERVIDTTADVAVGATAEYIETGDVTLEGTAMNAAVGSIGIAGEKLGGKLKSSAKFQQVKEGVSDAYHNAKEKASGAYQKAKDGVSGAYNTAKQKASDAADNMKEKFSQRKTTNADGAGSSQRTQGNESANRANESGSSQRTQGNESANRTNESGSSQRTQGNESANRTNESGSSQRTQGNESANRTNESGSSQRTQGNESANRTNESSSSQRAEGQARPMSEAEIKERISNLEPKLTDAKVANDIKNQYADFLNGSITDDAEFIKQFRKLTVKAHPDKTGGDHTLMQAILDVRECVNLGDRKKINEAYAKLNQVVNDKAGNLSKYQSEVNNLKSKLEQAQKAQKTQKAQEAPKTEQPQNNQKAQETPKTEQAQNTQNAQEAPKTEQPQNTKKAQEAPKTEQPQNTKKAQEAPKTEQAQNTQKTQEAPKTEQPQNTKKAQEAPKTEQAQNTQKTQEAPKTEQKQQTVTPQDKIEMGQIGNQINKAKSLGDFEKLQAQLDKMPDCQQKKNLQKQLDNQRQSFIAESMFDDVEPNTTTSQKSSADSMFDDNGYNTTSTQGSAKSMFNDAEPIMPTMSDEIKNTFSPDTQAKLSNLKNGQSVTLQKGNKTYIVTNHNGQIVIGAESSQVHLNTGNSKKTGLSDEIKNTFSPDTQAKLSNLKNGQSQVLYKGDWHYVAKNENGQIIIVKRNGNVDFSIPMSNRTPIGKKYKDSMENLLSNESKEIYRDSYGAYLTTKNKKIIHNTTNVLTQDNLLHGTDLDALLGSDGILEKGLIPRELSGNASAKFDNGSVPSTLTPLCTDVWDIRQNASIKDYFDARNPHWSNHGESNFLSNSRNMSSPVTIVLDKKSMHPDLIKNSFNVNQTGRSPLIRDGGIGGIGDGIHDYPTHRAIPIGAPANAIDRIIVDTRRISQADLRAIQNKINKTGLDIDVYDLDGNLLVKS